MKKLFLIILALVATSPIAQADSLEFGIALNPEDLRLEAVDSGMRILLPDYSPSGFPGFSALPTRILRFILPANADLQSLRYEVLNQSPPVIISLHGQKIELRPPLRLLCSGPCAGPSILQPKPSVAKPLQPLAAGMLGNMVIGSFIHRPVVYDERHDQLVFYPRQTIRVNFQTLAGHASLEAPSPAHLAPLAAELVVNPGPLLGRVRPFDDGEPLPGVAVVTTAWFSGQSQRLSAYLDSLEQRGFQVTLITEEQFDSVEGPPPNQRPQKLRTYLQQNYQTLNLQYLVLIGNPDPVYGDLPMLAAVPLKDLAEYLTETPTDAYYADMTGNWDQDGDGVYGEAFDDSGPGGVDFLPELQVGRIPVYGDVQSADLILERSIQYASQRGGTAWRRRILFPGAILFFANQEQIGTEHMEGGDIAEYMKPEFTQLGYGVTTLYEKEGVFKSIYDSDGPLTESQLTQEWNQGYGLVYWFGHGSEDAAYRTLWFTDADNDKIPQYYELSSEPFAQSIHFGELPADKPAMVFHGSCSNGTPETASNIGYTLLKSGAISTYSSTRVAFGPGGKNWVPDPSDAGIFTIGYFVISALRDGKTSGQALSLARTLMSDDQMIDYSWHTKLSTSLYGDPTLTIQNCQEDPDCDDGLACNGLERCNQGICEGGVSLDCSTLSGPCARGVCNEDTDQCEATPLDDKICSDGLFCTVGDRCQAGVCQGSPRTCKPEAEQCLVGVCNEEEKACVAARAPDYQECAFNDLPGECISGVCREKPADESCGSAPSSGNLGGGLPWIMLAVWWLRRQSFAPRARSM